MHRCFYPEVLDNIIVCFLKPVTAATHSWVADT